MHKEDFSPESLMMSYGYEGPDHQNAIKAPLYQVSTFQFNTAEEGKAFFESSVKGEKAQGKENFIYSRLSNPNVSMAEKRLALWEKADEAALFESGMAAISNMLLAYVKPGDVVVYSGQIYSGAEYLITQILPDFHISFRSFSPTTSTEKIEATLKEEGIWEKVRFFYLETPANPSNALLRIANYKALADSIASDCGTRPLISVDNTYLGPIWQHPQAHGADFSIYSATKYIGGHSDLTAGACLGSSALMAPIKRMRTYMGGMLSPHNAWLILRSLETLELRMEKQAANAAKVADFLKGHPAVEKVYYLGHLTEADGDAYAIFKEQCRSAGAMIAIDIAGGEKACYQFLNALKLAKLAVSLGSTESLAQHPFTMTHSNIPAESKEAMGITPKMIRLSIGVENADDLIADMKQALEGLL